MAPLVHVRRRRGNAACTGSGSRERRRLAGQLEPPVATRDERLVGPAPVAAGAEPLAVLAVEVLAHPALDLAAAQLDGQRGQRCAVLVDAAAADRELAARRRGGCD